MYVNTFNKKRSDSVLKHMVYGENQQNTHKAQSILQEAMRKNLCDQKQMTTH